MFSTTELALLNRANVADAEASRIIDKYRQMVADLREALRISENTSNEWKGHAVAWRDHAKKLEGRISSAQVYLEKTGLSDSEIAKIIGG